MMILLVCSLLMFQEGGGQDFYELTTGSGSVASPCDLCSGDLDDDGDVDGADLATLLSHWGGNDDSADLNGDGLVDGADLTIQLTNWGYCSCMCVEWTDCTNPENLPNPKMCRNTPELITMRKCPDLYPDRVINYQDQRVLVSWWGADLYDPDVPQQARDSDLNGDMYVDGWDLILIYYNWEREY